MLPYSYTDQSFQEMNPSSHPSKEGGKTSNRPTDNMGASTTSRGRRTPLGAQRTAYRFCVRCSVRVNSILTPPHASLPHLLLWRPSRMLVFLWSSSVSSIHLISHPLLSHNPFALVISSSLEHKHGRLPCTSPPISSSSIVVHGRMVQRSVVDHRRCCNMCVCCKRWSYDELAAR